MVWKQQGRSLHFKIERWTELTQNPVSVTICAVLWKWNNSLLHQMYCVLITVDIFSNHTEKKTQMPCLLSLFVRSHSWSEPHDLGFGCFSETVAKVYIFECLCIQIYRWIILKAHFTSNRVSPVFLNSDSTDKKMKVKYQARRSKEELTALPFIAILYIKIYIK